MSLPNDAFNRTVTVQTTGGRDIYTAVDGSGNRVTDSFPSGTPISQVYSALNSMSTAAVPALLMSQTMSAQQFGQYLILTAQQSSLARGLQPAQRLTMMTTLAPYVALLNSGDLSGFVSVSGSIPVDGTVIMNSTIATFVGLINQYLAGTI